MDIIAIFKVGNLDIQLYFSVSSAQQKALHASYETNLYSPRFDLKSSNVISCQGADDSKFMHPQQVSCKRRLFSRQTGSSLVVFSANKDAGSSKGDGRALEAVLRLYTAIEQRNLSDMSDIIGEECRCICNFLSTSRLFYGKKQVLEFFSSLMRYLGNNIEFVIQPTLHDGMNVGISWRLEWKKTRVPMGKGFSFYMCHIYQGKALIRQESERNKNCVVDISPFKNVEMFMEPLLHIGLLRLKMMGFMMNIMDKMGSKAPMKVKAKRVACILFTLFLLAALMFYLSLSLD
ncbi:hypothetical protein RJ639_035169 [Escallonia herrerae]|uniref:Uncharacterized protein n=1 Tax=Escallonia herrerae TaxID=1293975 RepID=A0AA88WY56_9ASTE|nr:hypothetical protein RJ639_035169 [Escallonia herrerae]